MQFISDNSIQDGSLLSYGLSYSTKEKPTLKLNSNSGIYNPSDNVFKIFTNNIDALTIDANQILTGNGSGLTNVNYDAITNKPDLSTTYSSILNLNTLSTNSTLSINNLNATSTTIFDNLNSLSTKSILSISYLNATSQSISKDLTIKQDKFDTVERQCPSRLYNTASGLICKLF